MSFWGGPGGDIIVDPSGAAKTILVRSHKVRKKSINVQNNHSGVTADNYEPLLPAYEWECVIPWDDTLIPDVDQGLVENTKVTLKFKDATSSKFCILTNTIVDSLEESYDVDEDIIVVVASGKGGTLTRQVT